MNKFLKTASRWSFFLFVFSVISFQELAAQGFSDISEIAGISVNHDGGSAIDFMPFSSGAAWLDYDKDGHLDLYVSMRTQANFLYKNNGDGTFTDVAIAMGAADALGDGGGVSVADVNNDGWPDIYLANAGEDVLLLNNNGSSFTDITAGSGLEASGTSRSTTGSWGDYDGDGYLDLYLTQHVPTDMGVSPDGTHYDYFFHNNGDNTFTDVTSNLPALSVVGFGFIGGWTDFDKDGDMDIFLVNDCDDANADPEAQTPTLIFQNNGGTDPTNWNFTEVSVSAGIDDCRNGMGLAVGDYNRDGWPDYFYSNIGDCVLWQNDGDGTFSNTSAFAEIDNQDPGAFSWGTSFIDYDLDGWQDIVVAIGALAAPSSTEPRPNQLFNNDGDGTFTEVSAAEGFDDPGTARNIVFGDYDNDGDQDAFVVNYGEVCKLLRNDNNNGNHYLKIELQGTNSNRDGLGSKINVTTPDGVIQYYETRSGSNLGGGDDLTAYFGLGNQNLVTEVEVTWPSGEVQKVLNTSVDKVLKLVEPTGDSFTKVNEAAGVEVTHDGYEIAGMQVGSGAAWFDYNNDGNLDLYVTMRNNANLFYVNNGDGTFTENAVTLGVDDPTGDGSGVSIADFNNDGFQDIYLANNENGVLLKNNVGLNFTDITTNSGLLAAGATRTTSATWGDYDNDGNLDLFIVNHVNISDPYGPHQDYLFHNNGDETFTDVSAPLGIVDNLEGYGFIGGWSDYDGDGDMDILLVNDCLFSPPSSNPQYIATKLFRNDGGTDPLNWNWTQVSQSAGVDDCRNGMGLATGDYNRDGHMDFFYTNIGSTVLFENNGDGTFSDASESAQLGNEDISQWSWGTSFLDYDLDGWQDLVVAMGHIVQNEDSTAQNNLLYRNNGDGTFTDLAPALGVDNEVKTRNAVHGDYDNDGDPDLFYLNYGQSCELMRNDVDNGNHYLTINLEGVTSNRDGIGAKLKITTDDGTIQYFETRSGSNLGGGDQINPFFGLADQTAITELEIKWPSGIIQVLNNITADQVLSVTEPSITGVEVVTKVFLEGSFANAMMNDALRVAGVIPAVEPFTALGFTHVNGGGSETISNYASVMNVTGDNAIVDWIFVELRSKTDPTSIVGTRSALLQRDGDVVDLDGVSSVSFPNLNADNYYLAIRHRNHFGMRSNSNYGFSTTAGALLDFTDSNFTTFGTNARKNYDGTMLMFSGDSNRDGEINAFDLLLGWRPQNGTPYDYNTSSADFNLDAEVNAFDKILYWRINNSAIQQLD